MAISDTVERLTSALALAQEAQREFVLLTQQHDQLAPEMSMVLEAFASCDDVADAPDLVDMLRDDDPMAHRAAMIGLLAIGRPAIDALDAVLCEPDNNERTRAAVAQVMFFMSDIWAFERVLEVLGHPRCFELFGQWIDYGPAALEEDAGGRVLLTLKEEVELTVQRAISDLQSHSPAIDYGVVSILGAWQEQWAMDGILACLQRAADDDAWFAVIERGLWALSRWPASPVVDRVIVYLDSPHHQTTSLVLSALGDDVIAPTLALSLSWAEDAHRRYHRADAVRVLTRSMSSAATVGLLDMVLDQDILIRHMVWYALARRGAGVSFLIDQATQGDDLDAPEALEALSQCPAPEAREALSTLANEVEQLGDPHDMLGEYHYLIGAWDRSFAQVTQH